MRAGPEPAARPVPASRERLDLVLTLLRHEIRMLVRDRRTVVLSVLLPLVVMPLLLFASRIVEERRERKIEQTTFRYVVTGSQRALARSLVEDAKALPPRPRHERPDPGPAPGEAEEPLRLLELEQAPADVSSSLEAGDLHVRVETLSAAEAARDRAHRRAQGLLRDLPSSGARRAAPGAPVPALRLDFQANRDLSRAAARHLEEALERVREARRDALLRERGFPLDPGDVAALEEHDVAGKAQVSGRTLGRLLTLLLLLFLFTGGSVVATDTIAGEKERGTLETLLTTAADRLDVVLAKLLGIFLVALLISLIQVLNLLVYVGLGIIPLPRDFVMPVTPGSALTVLVLFVPVAALVSALLLLLSGYAKSYKEAQLYFFPAFLLGMLPGAVALLPATTLRSALVLVPVANIAVAVREVLVGRYDWPFLLLAWLVTSASAWLLVRGTMRALSVERLITASEREPEEVAGGPRSFPHQVLKVFALGWVLLFLVAVNVEALWGLERQVLVNVVGIFGIGSWIVIRRFRLDPREALALRAPRPAVWIAVLTGVPSGLLTAVGVMELASRLLPAPQRMFEEFARSLMPESLPLGRMLFLVALLPGICEEIAFRGLLLHGLHKRLHPVSLVLLVGGIFGLFHVSLFRLLPTAFLGVLLTALTLLTGSILPAMAWHTLNNALSVLAAQAGAVPAGLALPTYLAAAAVLALSFWIVYRCRTPYPGLRPWRRRGAPRPGPGVRQGA